MSKIIRTVRLGSEVVTLGEAERELFDGAEKQSLDTVGLAKLIDGQVEQVRKDLETEWEARLRQEMEYLQAEADKRMAEAEERFAEERAAVHQQRYDEGHQVGLDEREAEATEAVRRLEILHSDLVAERAQVLKDAEETVIDLAAALARRIVGFQVEVSPKVLIEVVRSALHHLGDRSNLEIKVHPEDLRIVRRFAAHWVEKVDQDAVLKVRASDHVARGGCMIEGREENVDARLEEQAQVLLDSLRSAFFAVHHEDESGPSAQAGAGAVNEQETTAAAETSAAPAADEAHEAESATGGETENE